VHAFGFFFNNVDHHSLGACFWFLFLHHHWHFGSFIVLAFPSLTICFLFLVVFVVFMFFLFFLIFYGSMCVGVILSS
jgi:hypothetical protein